MPHMIGSDIGQLSCNGLQTFDPVQYVDTLIVSDIHLGSRVSRARELLQMLHSFRVSKHRWRFRRLVLLGDIFDDLNFTRLKRHAWDLVGLFRQITDEESNAELIWLLGNHDLEMAEIMQHLVGMKVYREYEWQICEKRFLAMHGDQFDKWIMNYPSLVVDIPCWIYDMIQKFDGPEQRISRYVKDKSKVWLRINDRVAAGIVEHARKRPRRIDAAFCGHTHIAEAMEFKRERMWYYNTGCWTGKQAPTYATIDHLGNVEIREYQAETARVALAG